MLKCMPQAKKKEEKKEKSCLPKYKLHRSLIDDYKLIKIWIL